MEIRGKWPNELNPQGTISTLKCYNQTFTNKSPMSLDMNSYTLLYVMQWIKAFHDKIVPFERIHYLYSIPIFMFRDVSSNGIMSVCIPVFLLL